MKLGRRTELLTGAGAFALLGAAFVWQGVGYWNGRPPGFGLLGDLGHPWNLIAAGWFGLLGCATTLAALLFVRVRWTPPLPGAPIESAPDTEHEWDTPPSQAEGGPLGHPDAPAAGV